MDISSEEPRPTLTPLTDAVPRSTLSADKWTTAENQYY